MPKVPNKFPQLTHPTIRLAIIGDAPSEEDVALLTPFIGSAGQMLRRTLGGLNVSVEQCFLGNVIQDLLYPDETHFHSPAVQDGLAQLRTDLHAFRPNLTLLLGTLPFRCFCPQHRSLTDKGEPVFSLSNYRGSLLLSDSAGLLPENCQKVLPTYHPTYLFRAVSDTPYFRFDIAKAVRQAGYRDLVLPSRNINIKPSIHEVETYINEVRAGHLSTGFDVEGWNDNVGVTCLSIAKTPTDCLVIPFVLNGGRNYWDLDEETRVWKALADWLSDPNCGKIVTNAAYEQFILAWKHHICIVNVIEDTMLKHWECFCELEKSLAVQASIWTDEPYYKHERHSDSDDGKLLYNGKDSCVSIEASDAQELTLRKNAPSYSHYRFNISLLPAMQYMMLRGCKFDLLKANDHKEKATADHAELQQRISAITSRDFNVKSTKDKQWLLYEFFGYKPYERHGDSTKEEVLLRYYARDREPLLKLVIDAIQLRTRISDINKFVLNEDGRLRCNYNLVGTDTGRLSSSGSNALVATFSKSGKLTWESTGTNLQNVTKELRDCFIADSSEFVFWNCDLSGADGWTVSADLAALGNTTMLDDYLVGIKPAKVLLLMLDEYEAGRDPVTINRMNRSDLQRLTKAIKFPKERDAHGRPGDWKYLCMKRVQHGTNYDMQAELLSATIFKDSDGLIDLTTKQAGIYQYLYKLRYNPRTRTDWITRELSEKGFLQSASGIRRKFFNLRFKTPDPQVVRAALAFEPQANTTYSTNVALRNLWYDPKNRTSRGSFFIEPIQVHDAVSGQFKQAYAQWAVGRIRSYFDSELTIHGIKIKIPFEGGYGSDWLHASENEFS